MDIKLCILYVCLTYIVMFTCCNATSEHNRNNETSINSNNSIKFVIGKTYSKIFSNMRLTYDLNDNLNDEIFLKAYKKYLNFYKRPYNKLSKSTVEFKQRFALFVERSKHIIKSKIDYMSGKSKSYLEFNALVDKTEDELRVFYGSKQIKSNSNEDIFDNLINEYKEVKGEHQNGVDYRKTNCVTKARQQGDCGSCYAFAALSVVESMQCLDKKLNANRQPIILSPQELLDCGELFSKGCEGGLVDKSLEYFANQSYATRESCYKYLERKNYNCRKDKIDIENCRIVLPSSQLKYIEREEQMINHLNKFGPFVTNIYTPTLLLYHKDGIIENKASDKRYFTRDRVHSITVIGYGRDKEKNMRYWLIKNSWGKDWGHDGFAKIERGTNTLDMERIGVGLERF